MGRIVNSPVVLAPGPNGPGFKSASEVQWPDQTASFLSSGSGFRRRRWRLHSTDKAKDDKKRKDFESSHHNPPKLIALKESAIGAAQQQG